MAHVRADELTVNRFVAHAKLHFPTHFLRLHHAGRAKRGGGTTEGTACQKNPTPKEMLGDFSGVILNAKPAATLPFGNRPERRGVVMGLGLGLLITGWPVSCPPALLFLFTDTAAGQERAITQRGTSEEMKAREGTAGGAEGKLIIRTEDSLPLPRGMQKSGIACVCLRVRARLPSRRVDGCRFPFCIFERGFGHVWACAFECDSGYVFGT